MSRGTQSADFTELADFKLGKEEHQSLKTRKNVLKSKQVVKKGVEEVGLDEKNSQDPLVFVQRDGDRVTSVDFLCKCGRSASLRMEYDEE